MQGVPAYCQGCGYIFETQGLILKNVRNATFTNSGTRCPRCGASAAIADGTYTAKDRTISLIDGPPLTRAIVEQLMAAVHAPGVTAKDVLAFQAVAQGVANGEIDADTAEAKVREIGESFAALWAWTNQNAGALGVVVGLLTLLATVIFGILSLSNGSKEGSPNAPTEPTIEMSPYREHIERKVYAALQGGSPSASEVAARPSPPSKFRPTSVQARMPVTGENRHTRRKADAIAKKRKRT